MWQQYRKTAIGIETVVARTTVAALIGSCAQALRELFLFCMKTTRHPWRGLGLEPASHAGTRALAASRPRLISRDPPAHCWIDV